MLGKTVRIAAAALLFCLGLVASEPCFAVSATPALASACVGGSRLNGSYGLLVTGGRFLTGVLNFNGACSLTGTNLVGGLNGQDSSAGSAQGTYGQNADGTFDLSLTLAGQSAAQTYTINVGASGIKANGIESDTSAIATIDLESQLTNGAYVYSNSNLSGEYSVTCQGQVANLNFGTFDGQGNLSGVTPYNYQGNIGTNPYSGTYSVNSDGSFSATLTGIYAGYTLAGVIDTGTSEIEYTYSTNGIAVTGCSGRQSAQPILSGYYGMLVSGPITGGGTGGKYLSGALDFSPSGTITATNLNGGLGSQYVNSTGTGSYVVNSNNTITITLALSGQAAQQTYVVAVSAGGNEAVGIETDGTAQSTIDLEAQLVSNSSSYSTASLVGTYAAYCVGPAVDLNYVTFDGKGNQTGIAPYNNGTYSYDSFTGTYTVNPDGTFSGGFTDASNNAFTYTGVIDNLNSEIEWTYNLVGTGPVAACTGYSTYGPVGTAPSAATVAFAPAPGAYSASQTVTMTSATPGAKIYYTTNGITPTTASLPYTGPIAVAPNTSVEAIAVLSGLNNSAIAAGTYFGAGAPSQAAATPSFSLTPGSYTSAQTVAIADATADAVIYFTTNGTSPTESSAVYSAPIQVSATTTIEAIAVAPGYAVSATATGSYTIGTSASSPTAINLSSYSNVYGIASAGTAPRNGGYDGYSNAYNSSLLGSTLSFQGLTFGLGAANVADAVSSVTIPAIAGQFSQLVLLGSAVNGSQTNQRVTVTYTDGTRSIFNQNFSDWHYPQSYAGETIVSTTANRIVPGGQATGTGPFYVYGYTFALNSGKSVASVTLPSNRSVDFLAMGFNSSLTPVVNLSSYYNVYGIASPGSGPKSGGFDQHSYAYNGSQLGSPLTFQGVTFPLGPVNSLDAVTGGTIPVSGAASGTLELLGASANGPITNQTVLVTYTDGTKSTFTQSFSDWGYPRGYQGETAVSSMATRINRAGETSSGPWYVYGYSFSLTPGKSVASVSLPSNRNVVFLGMGFNASGPPAVNLSSYYDVVGIGSPGTAPKSGGFDGYSNAFNSTLLGSSLAFQGQTFTLGPINAADAVNLRTISIAGAPSGTLNMLGAAVFGHQLNQIVTVNYTDGSRSTFIQNFSDWGAPQKYTGETIVSSTANRITPNGQTSTNGPWYVYGYSFSLTPGKFVSSVTLPNNRDVVFLGMGFGTVTVQN